jgi:hypothetical protein
VPEEIPLTMPVAAPTVAIVVGAAVQVPPVGVLPKVVVRPAHTLSVPVMAVGKGFTVTL